MTASIVLIGAASQVGYRLIPLLQEHGCATLAVSRRGKPAWGRGEAGVRWISPLELPEFSTDASVLISAGPLTLAAELSAGMIRLKQIIALSSASVQFKSDSVDRSEQRVMATLLQAEQQLEQLSAERSVALTIFRPTMIYGSGLDENLCRLARWARRYGCLPVAGEGSGRRHPIFAGDLARLIMEAVMAPSSRQGMFPVAGASQLSYRELLLAVFKALGQKPRLVKLPVPLYAQVLRLYSMLRPGAGVSMAMAARQNRDLLVNTGRMHEVFTFKPGEFRLREEHLLPPGTKP